MNFNFLTLLLIVTVFLGLLGLILSFVPIYRLSQWWDSQLVNQLKNIDRSSTRIEPTLHPEVSHSSNDVTSASSHSDNTHQNAQKTEINHFVVLYLMAPEDKRYPGYEVWQALSASKLEYGQMKIFHAYEIKGGSQQRLFSVANAVEPGYFDMKSMGASHLTGLCLFMNQNETSNPWSSFQKMLSTAQQLSIELGGTVCDHHGHPLKDSSFETYKKQLTL